MKISKISIIFIVLIVLCSSLNFNLKAEIILQQDDDISILCGYVNDSFTGQKLANVSMNIFYSNSTTGKYGEFNIYTDNDGFYSINITPSTFSIYMGLTGYLNRSIRGSIGVSVYKWLNISLKKYPSNGSYVFGYVTDNATKNPIYNVSVDFTWYDFDSNWFTNSTKTDINGFYKMYIFPGNFTLEFLKDEYCSKHSDIFSIIETYDLCYNISLNKVDQETTKLCGFVKDETTDESVENATIEVYGWGYNCNGYFFVEEEIKSNSSGFYQINVSKGDYNLHIIKDNYFGKYVSYFKVNKSDIFWKNITLDPVPEKNSVICGYITDKITGLPIENVSVKLWSYEYGVSYTFSNSTGFYFFNVSEGFYDLRFEADNYYTNYGPWDVAVDENEIVWINSSLNPKSPKPVETVWLCGYIKEFKSKEPIMNISVQLYGGGYNGYDYYNQTLTDSNGYYFLKIPKGDFYIDISKDGYIDFKTELIVSNDDQIIWFNESIIKISNWESSVIRGYVTNELTGGPIDNIDVSLSWRNENGDYYFNKTKTDQFGYYEINVCSGEVSLGIISEEYFYNKYDLFIRKNHEYQLDFELYPKPIKNSKICGYVKDKNTNEPIQTNYIYLEWKDDLGHTDFFANGSNSTGYYSIDIPEGMVILRVRKDNYYEDVKTIIVEENNTYYVNFSLWYKPDEPSLISGYIYDNCTKQGVENACITIFWHHDGGSIGINHTYSDVSGYYEIHVPEGLIDIKITHENYIFTKLDNININDFENINLDFSLKKEDFQITITKPQKGLYLNNNLVRNYIFRKPLIIGKIDIEINENQNISFLEIFIGDELKSVYTEPPFIYTWDKKNNHKLKHTITVIAYSSNGVIQEEKTTVWRFF